MKFAKAHGLGNDFILVAADLAPAAVSGGEAAADASSWAVRLCDRHHGIGGDGVVLHAPTADGMSFRLINADGLPGEISGNGLRCLAALAVRNGWAAARHVVSTVVGPKAVEVAVTSRRRPPASSGWSITRAAGGSSATGTSRLPSAGGPRSVRMR